MVELDAEYVKVLTENEKLSEESARINAFYQNLKQKLQQTMTQHETTSEKLKEAELYMWKLNKSKIKLDEILEIRRVVGDHTGLSYVNKTEASVICLFLPF